LHYPYPPKSFLLENKNNRFIDITSEKAPGLSDIGMVTSALWTDLNGDGDIDLMIAGEWMPVTPFINRAGTFKNMTNDYGLTNTTGWWNSISSGNFDNDDNPDYILGNLGLNNPYNASVSDPLSIVSKDFNNDGITDPILVMKYIDGYFPVASRSQFLAMFPQKTKKYDTYEAYAKTNAEDLLKDLGTNGQHTLEAKLFANSILLNTGNRSPAIKPLPGKAQFSPIFGTLCYDFITGKKTEILAAGNFYSANVTDGPYSASTGAHISVDTVDNIKVNNGSESGFYNKKDARALASLVLGNQKRIIIVTNNNDSLKVFSPAVQNEKHIRLHSMDAYAIIEWNNGHKQKQEFYYGSGYLSQSSRYLSLIPGWKKVKIVTYTGKERIITP
jgi:hypothetical protein